MHVAQSNTFRCCAIRAIAMAETQKHISDAQEHITNVESNACHRLACALRTRELPEADLSLTCLYSFNRLRPNTQGPRKPQHQSIFTREFKSSEQPGRVVGATRQCPRPIPNDPAVQKGALGSSASCHGSRGGPSNEGTLASESRSKG
jgi:hypothetical protein